MAKLSISVANKVATYSKRCGEVVCGNSDYEIEFAFDSEWDAYEEKTARFIWGGKFHDVPFTGTLCQVPLITDTQEVTVGVYAGDLRTSTPARVPCVRSILCAKLPAQPEAERDFASEAQKAATEAKEAAAEAQEAADISAEILAKNEQMRDMPAEVVRGEANGAVVTLVPVSPIEHTVHVKVESGATVMVSGKNLFDTSADVERVWAYYGFDITEKAKVFGTALLLSINLKPGKSVPQKINFGFAYYYTKADGGVVGNVRAVLTNGSVTAAGVSVPRDWHTQIGVCAYSLDTTIRSHAQAFEAVLDAFDVQLEVGATKTEYVPFSFYEEYTADENGEVDIPSRSPYMLIAPKATGLTVSATYNRDLAKAITLIEKALTELGVTFNALLGV